MFHLTRSIMLSDNLTMSLMLTNVHIWNSLGMDPLNACITVRDVLTVIGEELWTELPADAHGQVLILHLRDLYIERAGVVVVGASDYQLPVRIDPAWEKFPEGSVCIGFGQGNLESFRIPPPGVLGME
ncbi:MAG: hypothetical protein UX47_C0004G0055 [Candidatus Collierbacteria bacterium GW2011_GWA2_46_26]|uniref:Uncharacterized protein n=1 Tax=Candidatus Collierbacteria bacterium GW2011_GWA2_46_26 TaxID=1618381 RepID=A0A0G1SJA6_9BACT|nr:MAG: hypothetical protein UX47_C0004G0055 [Candidatus Collierbacteria bacterium GW2011_GWA2_46_26]